MNARLAGAALWAAASCLPRSDDLGSYSAEWAPGADAGTGNGGIAGASSAGGAGAADAGGDGVVGGGSFPLGGASGASAAGGNALGGTGGSSGGDTSGADEPCLDGIRSEDESRCYVVSDATATWSDARDECTALQAVLVKVETAEEDAFLATLLAGNQWLGASDTLSENVFVWLDGAAIEFGNWGPNQPDRFPGPDCVEKRNTEGRQWFDQPCDNLRSFVCERASTPGAQ